MFSVTLTPLGTSRQGNRAASVPCLPSVTERHTSEAPPASGGGEQTARSLSARLWPEQGRPRRLTAAAQSAVVGAAAAACVLLSSFGVPTRGGAGGVHGGAVGGLPTAGLSPPAVPRLPISPHPRPRCWFSLLDECSHPRGRESCLAVVSI